LIGDGGDDNKETLLCYLVQAGYDAQFLQATLIQKTAAEEDRERITEPNTVEHVRALAALLSCDSWMPCDPQRLLFIIGVKGLSGRKGCDG